MKINSITNLPWKKVIFSALMAGSLAVLPALRASLPTTASSNLTTVYASGGAVSTTQATGGANTTLTVTSTAPITVLNWGNFWDGTAAGGTAATTDFIVFTLPGATSSILNEIAGTGTTNPTTLGNLSSNGKVFLLNPNGFLATGTGTINTAGFYLSTLQENVSYFEQNGTLQVFSSTPPVGATTGTINVSQTISTVGGSGDVRLAGNGVIVNGTINGNAYIVDVGGATPGNVQIAGSIASTTIGGVTVGGNLTVSGTNANVLLSQGGVLTVGANLSVSTGGGANGNVNLGATNATTVTGTSTINTVGATNGSVTDTDGINALGGLAVTTGSGSGTLNGSASLGSVTVGSNPVSVTGGSTTISDTGSDTVLTLGTSTIAGTLSINTGGTTNIVTQNFGSTSATPATVTMTSTSSNGISLTAGGKINFNGTGNENFTGLNATGSSSITTTGNISLAANVSIATLSLATTAGTISQPTNLDINAATLTVNAPTITLASTAGNAITNAILIGGATGGVTLIDGSNLTIANKTATTGNTTITDTGGNVALGAANSDVVSFGGNLTVSMTNAGANFSTLAGNVSVTGNTSISSTSGTGTIQLGNGAATPVQSYTFTGPISITSPGAGNVSIFGTSGVVLGAISTTNGNLEVDTTMAGTGNAGISNPTGLINLGSGTLLLGSGSSTAPSNIQIGGATNAATIGGTISVGDAGGGATTLTANNVSITNTVSTTLVSSNSAAVKGLTSVTETSNGAPTAVTIGTGGTTGNFSNVSVSQTGTAPSGAIAVSNGSGAIALSNWSIASGGGTTVSVSDSAGAITLGAGINDNSAGLTTLTASSATSANIIDTASSPVAFYGPVSFISAGPINISNNTANNLGAVTLTLTGASNNGNITYTEGGGVNLAGISAANGSYSGTVSITSVGSIILENAAGNLVLPLTSKLNLTATSAGGAVLLTSTVAGVNQILAPVSIAATGNSVIWDQNNLLFAGVNITTGTFVANTTEAEGITIGEQAGTTVYSYGNDTFKTAGGTVTLGNSGNNFGAIAVDTTVTSVIGVTANPAGANVSIKEYGGNNYASVNTGTGGNFSTTSEQSIILETGNTGVSVGGTTTLSAPNGSIFFTATGNDFNLNNIAATGSTLKVTTTGNATITDTGGTSANAAPVTTLADGTSVTGTLQLTLSNGGTTAGTIRDNGTTGNVTIGTGIFVASTSGTSSISFTGGNNAIANLEIKAGTGSTVFNDNASVNILPGTAVSGSATISSGGSITMTTAGPVTFLGTLGLNSAGGNITFSDTSALFNAKVTAVDAAPTGDVNFSGLSLATNFNGVAPAVTTANNATYYQAPGP